MARSLKQHFTEWCRQQGERKYEYSDISGCALCQFLSANGYAKDPRVGGFHWRDNAAPGDARLQEHTFDKHLADALVSWPRTFAALADRLSA